MKVKHNTKELTLITRCLKNDRRAQKELFNKYKDAMYTLTYRITGNHNDAEDAMQEAFINIFMKLDLFKGDSALGAWIKTICIRSAIKKTKLQFKYDDIINITSKSELEIDEFLSGEAIEKALLNLHNGYRTVFMLIEVEGYKHKEVAQILGISEGTSKSQLFHAKKQLQKELEYLKC